MTFPQSHTRPGMGTDDKVINPMLYANDVLKDVAQLLTNPKSSSDIYSTPLFMVDDLIVDGDDTNPGSGGRQQQLDEEGNTNKKDSGDRRTVMFSESPSLVHHALKEGFKDETFGTNELMGMISSNTAVNSPWHDNQSSHSSSLSSSSFSSCELNEDFVKNNWYQVGMDKDVLGIAETMPGLEFDVDGYINCTTGGGSGRLAHPPLF
ncbi:uncharacterized protein BX664DRAFT_325254 [Halteromyces radiatus]|uniref:uncharacterized protein n=1 Tax=Halteromyces radiatus TaxID=101107 RepID=UPI00221FEC9E|nr:uncharacterized protein BX664DRAFT_325254 [Halteromyces radiatus]KAI8096948.1 hypothetical protein BX664DRAFT_325254 [Halteromyces radiatus]